MHEETHGGPADIPDPNEMLDVLLERLEDARDAIRSRQRSATVRGREAELTERLRVTLPGVRFKGQNVRTRSA